MPNRIRIFSLLSLAAVSCAGSHAEEVRDARMERIEAKTEAKQEHAEERAEQREKATEKSYDAREERAENSDRPGEDAQEKLIELSKERAEFRSQIQARMEKLSIRINAQQQKLQVLGDRAPMQTRTELSTVVDQYNLLKQDVMQLETTPETDWEAKRNDIQRRTELLDERVSSLNDAVASI